MWQLYSTLESPMAAAHTLAKPIPGAHGREPNVMKSSCASYVLATAMARRNASSFIGRKASWADPCRHRSQRRIDQGRSPGGLLAAWGLEAFRHGDEALSTKHAELEEVPGGLNFHSTDGECNGVECWDPLNDAAKGNVERSESGKGAICSAPKHRPRQGHHPFNCYFPPLGIVARLFGPAIFEASKLKVLFLGVDEEKHPGNLPRAYTLTHSDITAKLTLAVSQTINKAQLQGWYNRLQRDEVVAEWRKAQGKMSLHVHCHISGGHWLLDAIAHLRFYIFRKELPVVLEAFRHGDEALFNNHPELEEALVWVYFHSNAKEFNRVECWGPLRDAAKGGGGQTESAREAIHNAVEEMGRKRPKRCPEPCNCCYPPFSLIPWPDDCETQL